MSVPPSFKSKQNNGSAITKPFPTFRAYIGAGFTTASPESLYVFELVSMKIEDVLVSLSDRAKYFL